MAWVEALPSVLTAVALLIAPGLLAMAPLRMRWLARVAVAAPLSVLFLGLAGVLGGALEAPFAAWHVLPFVGATFGALQLMRAHRRPDRPLSAERSRWPVFVSWGVAAFVICVVAFAAVPSPRRVSQTYDNVFHLSAVAAILDGRSASSLTLRTFIETDRSAGFYPAGWHSLVAAVADVTNADIAVAANSAWIAIAIAVWSPGVVWLTTVLLAAWPLSGRVEMVAYPLSAVFAAMPYSLLSWGTLYPTFLATALLPAAIAVPIAAFRSVLSTPPAFRWRVAVVGTGGVVVSVGALAFAQPRVLVSWALLLALPTVFGASRMLATAWNKGGRARTYAMWGAGSAGLAFVLAAIASGTYLVVGLGLFERPLEDRLGGPQAAATQDVATGIVQVATQSFPMGAAGLSSGPLILLATSIAIGFLTAIRVPRLRWVCLAYVSVTVLYALAAGSDDAVAKVLTGIWYKDRYRLSSILPVLGVALATVGIIEVARWMRRRSSPDWSAGRHARWLAWMISLVSATTLVFSGATAAIGAVFSMPAERAEFEVVSARQVAFMRELPRFVPDDQRLLGDPWDGSAWSQVFGDREPVFPHVNGQWDADRRTLASALDRIEIDPAVCAALDRLRVRFVLYNPHELAGGDPAGNLFFAIHKAVEADLFSEVVSDGETTLYRIDQCGALP